MFSPYYQQQQQEAPPLPQQQLQQLQQQQLQSSSTTGGLVWNGSSWVTMATVAPLSGAASAASFVAGTMGGAAALGSAVTDWGCNKSQVIPPSPIATFTDYYHKWMEKHAEQERLLHSLAPTSADRPAVQRQLEWYKYYADQSSRAAHYFYSHGEGNVTSAPFDLPPAPPQYKVELQQQPTSVVFQQENNNYHQTTTTTNTQQPPARQQPQQQPDPFSRAVSTSNSVTSASNESRSNHSLLTSYTTANGSKASAAEKNVFASVKLPPDSLKHYVDRCLSQYDNDKESKAKVMSMVQETMESCLKNGTLHYINWDTVPLIQLESSTASQTSHSKITTQAVLNAHSRYEDDNDNNRSDNNNNHARGGGEGDVTEATIVSPSFKQLTMTAPLDDNNKFNNTASASRNKRQRYKDYTNISNSSHSRTNTTSTSGGGGRYGNESNPEWTKRVHEAPAAVAAANSPQACLGGNKSWDRYMGKATIGGGADLLEGDYEKMKVKGTNKVLEKNYLRLTGPPKPENVRPQHILKEHLQNLKDMRRASQHDDHEGGSTRDYLWFCSQLKSIRQDLTVQHLVEKSAFAVDVYETHARIALEEGDLNEFNQCQTQLKELYSSFTTTEGSEQESEMDDDEQEEAAVALKNTSEFVAYRILYYILMSRNSKYDGGSTDFFKILLSLTWKQRQSEAIKHALSVREAIEDGNYHFFFTLRRTVPNLGGVLMDLMMPHVRLEALNVMSKAYRPLLNVFFVLKELGFFTSTSKSSSHILSSSETGSETEDKPSTTIIQYDESDKQFGIIWLKSCGCILSEDRSVWKTKDTVVRESKLESKQSLI